MNNRIPISEYRKKARVSLENQWGINTWLVFLYAAAFQFKCGTYGCHARRFS